MILRDKSFTVIKWAFLLLRLAFFRLIYLGSLRVRRWRIGIEYGAKLVIRGSGSVVADGELYVRAGSTLDVGDANLHFGDPVFINKGCLMVCRTGIEIGAHTIIGPGCMFFDHDHVFERTDIPFSQQGYKRGKIKIGRNVWLGAGVIVCKGVEIGDHCVIGAGTVLTKSVPPGSKVYRKAQLVIQPL
jgi:acetyltransferase-like isoleucine patch superfamily enzyme